MLACFTVFEFDTQQIHTIIQTNKRHVDVGLLVACLLADDLPRKGAEFDGFYWLTGLDKQLIVGRVGINKGLVQRNFCASGWVGDGNEPVDWEWIGFTLIIAIAFEYNAVGSRCLFWYINKITFFVFFNDSSGNTVGGWPVVYS